MSTYYLHPTHLLHFHKMVIFIVYVYVCIVMILPRKDNSRVESKVNDNSRWTLATSRMSLDLDENTQFWLLQTLK